MISGPTFNEHRNTSRVWPVPPTALPAAKRALESLRRDDPALVQWLADGAPNLTHEEHLRRFGVPYQSVRARRPAPSGASA